ncbi:MAG: cbb3-type cytochrome c oxidase subunit 3 [Chitinophagaceae bacterium]|nr:cbb3-type cytochrome c oxidase subunit 3 [Chitinophagaceae bacterium]MBK8607803.1 cbb3-type cytochrome c oxidase subunit 3 [Chitinophagaceae bacterium]MBP6478426.1 cbb3-type cytochrome c oxidase subunit 3 [Chitinophagaceae bacterium]MBP7109550.1 cbb3-type cytochrome c oxidase subunit 3 [Chitinophagaceae bacterium]MBP7315724.1 cbb3-type cytochrome c oxidase subunit 3 [Chitinophagaceae bacterium]
MKFINYIEKVSGVDILGLLSLLVFFLFFIGMLVWVFKTKKKDFNEVSRIPLDNDNLPTQQ